MHYHRIFLMKYGLRSWRKLRKERIYFCRKREEREEERKIAHNSYGQWEVDMRARVSRVWEDCVRGWGTWYMEALWGGWLGWWRRRWFGWGGILEQVSEVDDSAIGCSIITPMMKLPTVGSQHLNGKCVQSFEQFLTVFLELYVK